jgi:Asp-tRNA(Asn)/Glu-tRNA(Gln) amidotransferase A subunit family amidase
MGAPALHRLSASEARRLIRTKKLGIVEYAEALTRRIEAREGTLKAWQHFDADAARTAARWVERNGPAGPLHGIPLGVKDIIETRDMPTTYGAAPLYGRHRPAWDASCVALAKAAGAVIMGKTVTSEFAGYYTGPTVNPHDPTRSPAFSSMGSAAAVADHHVPLAFGSQTGGSIIRPAAHCGAVGYMPSYGLFNTTGVHNLAPSLDHLGHFARTVDDIALMGQVLLGDARFGAGAPARPPRLGLLVGWEKRRATPEIWRAMEDARARLADAKATIVEIKIPRSLVALSDHCVSVIRYETARTLAHEYLHGTPGGLSATMRDLVASGLAMKRADYLKAQEAALQGRALLAGLFKAHDVDVLLAPSAECLAQPLEEAISRSVFNRLWTILHVPTLAFTTDVVAVKPTSRQPRAVKLPVGVQLVGRFLKDHEFLQAARWAESRIGRIPEPMNW